MREKDIKPGNSYEVSMGRGKAIVTVTGIAPSGSWQCTLANGTGIKIGAPDRFLRRLKAPPGKEPKEAAKTKHEKAPVAPTKAGKGKAVPKEAVASEEPQKAAQTTVGDTQIADPETIARLTAEYKEAVKRAKVARQSLAFGFIDQSRHDEVNAEWKAAKVALYAAGGKPEKRGRCTGQMSGKEAAYRVLIEEGRAMRAREITDMAVHVKKYWSPEGATPEATLASAIGTEIQRKGGQSRFLKVGPGLFTVREGVDE